MIDLDKSYEVRCHEGHPLAEIKKREFRHLNTPAVEYRVTEEGLTDLQGALVAKWDGGDLIRLDDGLTRFTLHTID